jgi:hypothetical protein
VNIQTKAKQFKTYGYEKDDGYCSDDERDAHACTDDGKGEQE